MNVCVLQFSILLVIIASAYAQTIGVDGKPYYDLNKSPELYVKFLKDYNVEYPDVYELLIHYEAFKNSLKLINESNRAQDSATFDINYMADWTNEQIRTHILPP